MAVRGCGYNRPLARAGQSWNPVSDEAFEAEADRCPSAGTRERFADIQPGLAELLEQAGVPLTTELPRFNELVRSKGVPTIILSQDAAARR